MAVVINVHVWPDSGEKLRNIERETGCTTGEVFERLVQRADTSPLGSRFGTEVLDMTDTTVLTYSVEVAARSAVVAGKVDCLP
jgi:hypothetical protein